MRGQGTYIYSLFFYDFLPEIVFLKKTKILFQNAQKKNILKLLDHIEKLKVIQENNRVIIKSKGVILKSNRVILKSNWIFEKKKNINP